MPVFSIAADQHRPSEGDGCVRAETIQEAVALIGHPDVNVSPLAQLCAAWMSARQTNLNVRVGSKSDLQHRLAQRLECDDEPTFESKDRLYSVPDGRGRRHKLAREILE